MHEGLEDRPAGGEEGAERQARRSSELSKAPASPSCEPPRGQELR
jgi:hypothetical protein